MSDQETDAPREPLDTAALIAIMIDQLASVSWQKLGLQPDMAAGRIVKDLPQAKLAIDAVAALAELIDSKLDDDDRRSMQNLIRDLRLNYIEKGKEASS